LKRYALTIKILLAFFATIALMIILLGWRLAMGPIALDWAGDYLKQALTINQKNINLDFRDALLIWREQDNQIYGRPSGLQIIFYEVQITDRKTDFTLNVPEAGMSLSGLAMLRGLLAPTDIEIYGLSIDYTLDPDIWTSTDKRPFMTKLEAFIATLQNAKSLPFEIAEELLSPPKSSAAAGYLSQFSLLDTKITLTDPLSGQIWLIPEAHLNLLRTDLGLSVRLLGDINMAANDVMPIDIVLTFDNAKKEAITSLEFSELRLSAFAGKVDALSALANLNIPARGKIDFTVDRNFKIPVVDFSLALGKGSINPTGIYPEPLKITSAALSGHIDKAQDSIVLNEISLQLGQTFVSGSGLLYGPLDTPGVAIKADITDLPFSDLKTYWPGQFGKGAYKWISKNIETGMIPDGQLDVYIKPEMWPEMKPESQEKEEMATRATRATLPADSVTFKFNFNDISAHYLRPMPILRNMSGQAELNLQSFHLKAGGGAIGQLSIDQADLLFSNIHVKGKAIADITVDLTGAAQEVLRIIDYKPLGYPSKYGIKQGSITGQAKAVLSLNFPLLKKVSLKDVVFDVEAQIERLSIPKLNENLAINDGQMQLFVDGMGLSAEGNITLNDVALEAKWQESFTKEEDLPTKYTINGLIEGAEWEQLNLPFDPYIEGPVEIDLTLLGKGGAIKQGYGQFNLLNSKTSFKPVGWEKAKGKASQVDFDLTFSGPGLLNITNVILQSEALAVNIELDMVDDRVTRFSMPKFIMQDTDIVMLMTWDEQKEYYLSTLSGRAFNASALIEILMSSGSDDEKVNLPDFDLTAEVDDLLTKNNVRLDDIKLSAKYRGQDFTHVNLEAKIQKNKNITVTITPDEDENTGNHKLEFASNDAGEALRGLGMFNLGVGGDMILTADMVKHEHGISLGGKAKVTKFKVIKSPGFSKLLDEKNFMKAREELNKEGLSFNDFQMEFRTYNGVMEISKARARGPMLGMTIDGMVDQTYDEMSISGTIIPAYGINSLLSNIPLIGTILTGGKGQGIFAATYNISGPLDNPKININPLAALAPGILRSIFSSMGGKKKTLREQAEEMQDIIPNNPPTSNQPKENQ